MQRTGAVHQPGRVSEAERMPFRCWMLCWNFRDPVAPDQAIFPVRELEITAERAREFGVNTLELIELDTYGLVPHARFPELRAADSARRNQTIDFVQRFCRTSRDHGLDPYVFVFELLHLREIGRHYPAALDPKGPLLWDIIAERVSETFELFPQLAGIEIYADEGPCISVSGLTEYDMPAREIVARLITTYLGVCRAHGKQLIFSTFANRAHHLRNLQAGLKLVPPSPDLAVNQWTVPGDWGEYLNHNPIIGDVGGHPEIITFDYAAENWGQCQVPFCFVEHLRERWLEALDRSPNVIGTNGWCLSNQYVNPQRPPFILDTANEVNAYALARLADSPDAGVEAIWEGWAARCAPDPEVRKVLTRALQRTQSIGEAAWMAKGFWFMESPKSQLPSVRWALHSPYRESSAEWDEGLRPIEDALFFPTEALLDGLIADREEAIRLARQSCDDIHAVEAGLAPAWRRELCGSLDRLVAFCEASRHYTELFFRWKLWWLGRAGGEPERIDANMRDLEALADALEARLGANVWPANPARMRRFCVQIRLMMGYGRAPVADWSGIMVSPLAKRIVSSILDRLAVVAETRSGEGVAGEEQQALCEVERLTTQLVELRGLYT